MKLISRTFSSGAIEITPETYESRSSSPRIFLSQTVHADRPYVYSTHHGRHYLSPGWTIA